MLQKRKTRSQNMHRVLRPYVLFPLDYGEYITQVDTYKCTLLCRSYVVRKPIPHAENAIAKCRRILTPKPFHVINRLLTTAKAEHQVQGTLLLDVVVAQRTPILQLLTSENQSLLVRWDTLLILDLRFDIINCVRRLNL